MLRRKPDRSAGGQAALRFKQRRRIGSAVRRGRHDEADLVAHARLKERPVQHPGRPWASDGISRLCAVIGEQDADNESAGRSVLRPYASAMHLYNGFCDGKAQARAARFARARFIDAVKADENAGQLLLGNAAALVLHTDFHAGLPAARQTG